MERRVAAARFAVGGIKLRFPLHRVQIRDLHLVAGIAQPLHREIADGAVERGGFGVGVDEKDVHDGGFHCKR
ncbi:hypothetical protein D9M72_481750 [compost metagenome]